MIESTISVVVTDDLSGAKGASTVTFGLEGKTYEIDLTPGNQRALAKSLKKYVEAARVTPPRRTGFTGSRKAVVRTDVRKWAAENGYEISDRGRIRFDILAAYEKAISGTTDDTEV